MITEEFVLGYDSVIGGVEIRGTEKGITSIRFTDAALHQEETEATDPSTLLRAGETDDSEESPFPDSLLLCRNQLDEYFQGKRKRFDSLPLIFRSTDFQKTVWEHLMEVPFGETVTYGELAKAAGYDGAARAVGTAMNQNPLCIIVPCHRVLPSTRAVGEYAGGVHRKEWLLAHESR